MFCVSKSLLFRSKYHLFIPLKYYFRFISLVGFTACLCPNALHILLEIMRKIYIFRAFLCTTIFFVILHILQFYQPSYASYEVSSAREILAQTKITIDPILQIAMPPLPQVPIPPHQLQSMNQQLHHNPHPHHQPQQQQHHDTSEVIQWTEDNEFLCYTEEVYLF